MPAVSQRKKRLEKHFVQFNALPVAGPWVPGTAVCKQFNSLSRRNGNTSSPLNGDLLALVGYESWQFLTAKGYHAEYKGLDREDWPMLPEGQSSNISFTFFRVQETPGWGCKQSGFGAWDKLLMLT